jgi:hypothetical protein
MIIIYSNKKEDNFVSIEDSVKLIKKIKDTLKEKVVIKDVCKEYGFSIDIIDGIIIKFDKIDTSAETVNGEMILNTSLTNEDFDVLMRYPVHELVHVFQHMEREGTGGDPYHGMKYLDRPDEVEAFVAQIKDEGQTRGTNKAEEYVNELLDYHDIPENKKDKYKNNLLGK